MVVKRAGDLSALDGPANMLGTGRGGDRAARWNVC